MSKRVLVFGAGLVAGPLVDYLVERGFGVTVACRTPEKGTRLTRQRPGTSVVPFDIDRDAAAIDGLLATADVAVSMLPYVHHVTLAKRCVASKKPLVTTSYVSDAMRALDGDARAAGIVLFNEAGLDPGIDHMSAMKVIDRVHAAGGKVLSFTSYCGGLPAPEANDNPLGYKFSWSPRGVLLASRNAARFLRDGRQVDIPGPELFTHHVPVEVPGAGTFDGYPNRDSTSYVERYGIPETRTMLRGTLRNRGWCESLKAFADLGLLDDTLSDWTGKSPLDLLTRKLPKPVGRDAAAAVAAYVKIPPTANPLKVLAWLGLFSAAKNLSGTTSPLDLLVAIMLGKMPYAPGERDMVLLQHEFVVETAGHTRRILATLVDYGTPNGPTSMSRTVGLPAAIAVSMILEGRVKAVGVQIPLSRDWYDPILAELERLGIAFRETEQPVEGGSFRIPEGSSLFGKPLHAVPFPAETEARYQKNLAEAETRFRAHPGDEDALVWHGRRLGYLTRYREAIQVYTDGLALHPDSFRILRHRGHRLISVRRFSEAAADLLRARDLTESLPDEVEQDGEPNKAGIPTSTLRFNILYHLGLARYLLGDFATALADYRRCMEYSSANVDSLVATSDWLYMTLRRLGRHAEAERVLDPITPELPIVENFAYHHRLLLYKGLKKPEELLKAGSTTHHDTATHGYGIGNWYLCNGDRQRARETFEAILATSFWPAFGFIAAEADMQRGV